MTKELEALEKFYVEYKEEKMKEKLNKKVCVVLLWIGKDIRFDVRVVGVFKNEKRAWAYQEKTDSRKEYYRVQHSRLYEYTVSEENDK